MRMTLKVSGFIVLIFVLAGCATQSDKTAAPSVSPTSISTASTNVAISPELIPDCASGQLSVIDGRVGVAMGNVGDDGIAFKNVSTSACRLKGFPNIQLLDVAGNPIVTHLNKGTSYTVQATPEKLVTLLPNDEALFDLGYTDATGYGTEKCPTAFQEAITPPGSTKSIIVAWEMTVFGGDIPHLRCGEITVSPVYASPTEHTISALTVQEYAFARDLVRREIRRLKDVVTSASVTLSSGKVMDSNTGYSCTSGRLLNIKLMGDFVHLVISHPAIQPGAPQPDFSVHAELLTADAKTGRTCLIGVDVGKVAPDPGAASIALK